MKTSFAIPEANVTHPDHSHRAAEPPTTSDPTAPPVEHGPALPVVLPRVTDEAMQTEPPSTADTALDRVQHRGRSRTRQPVPHPYLSVDAAMPAQFQRSQSPLPSGRPRSPAPIIGRPAMDALLAAVATDRAKPKMNIKGGTAAKSSTNVFRYQLQLTYRVGTSDGAGVSVKERHDEVSASSSLYQSSGDLLPTGDTDADRTLRGSVTPDQVNRETRAAIVAANTQAARFDEFADTTLGAFAHRNGKVDFGLAATELTGDSLRAAQTKALEAEHAKKSRRRTDEQVKGQRYWAIPNQTVGCPFFHSETQALGAADREVPAIVDRLMDTLLGQVPDDSEVVLNNVQVLGASDPNTVCDNACKPALTLLLDRITDELDLTLEARAAAARARSIVLRPSSGYAVHMSVGAREEFKGYRKGAHWVDEAAVAPPDGTVTEYEPAVRKPAASKRKTPPPADDQDGHRPQTGPDKRARR